MLSFLLRLNENMYHTMSRHFGLGYQTGYQTQMPGLGVGCQGQCFRLHLRISLLSLNFPGTRRRLGCEFSGDQVRQDQVRSSQIRSGQTRSDQGRSGQGWSLCYVWDDHGVEILILSRWGNIENPYSYVVEETYVEYNTSIWTSTLSV